MAPIPTGPGGKSGSPSQLGAGVPPAGSGYSNKSTPPPPSGSTPYTGNATNDGKPRSIKSGTTTPGITLAPPSPPTPGGGGGGGGGGLPGSGPGNGFLGGGGAGWGPFAPKWPWNGTNLGLLGGLAFWLRSAVIKPLDRAYTSPYAINGYSFDVVVELDNGLYQGPVTCVIFGMAYYQDPNQAALTLDTFQSTTDANGNVILTNPHFVGDLRLTYLVAVLPTDLLSAYSSGQTGPQGGLNYPALESAPWVVQVLGTDLNSQIPILMKIPALLSTTQNPVPYIFTFKYERIAMVNGVNTRTFSTAHDLSFTYVLGYLDGTTAPLESGSGTTDANGNWTYYLPNGLVVGPDTANLVLMITPAGSSTTPEFTVPVNTGFSNTPLELDISV